MALRRYPQSLFLLALLLLLASGGGAVPVKAEDNDDLDVGPRDRFWRHHVTQKSLVKDGVDYYQDVESCLNEALTEEDWKALKTKAKSTVGLTLEDKSEKYIYTVVVKNAITAAQVKAVQSLAACGRKHIPGLYESRAMYQELSLDEDPGLGGNCPTHMAPLISIFLPDVSAEMSRTLQFAFKAAGWKEVVAQDKRNGLPRDLALPNPSDVGFRASEHLTYKDFPTLAEHTDGGTTAYTMNYAFSDDYGGGEFFIMDKNKEKYHIKPTKYDALVFLGGRYMHGVEEITSGNREMFSTEWWAYPDIPFGNNLWTSVHENMEEYIRRCNKQLDKGDDGPCKAEFPNTTGTGMEVDENRKKYARPNRVRPDPLVPVRYADSAGNQYDLDSFRSEDEEPHFLIPKKLEPGEMHPIRFRDNLEPVGGSEGESFVIGLPQEVLKEFQTYIERNGMMEIARKLLYDEKPLRPGEHKLYTLDDGNKWSAMIQGSWHTDMIWLDPADEKCFESLVALLRRGGFDTVLDKVGKAFDLNGLMIQGVGAIFLSQNEGNDNMHIDLQGSKGSFYNIIVPVHIPEDDEALFFIGDDDSPDNWGLANLKPDVGFVLGGESLHGTGKCNYRKKKDLRLSFAVYIADVNEDNAELIASDNTSLWPSIGDTRWFTAQEGRMWSKDGIEGMANDKGRKPLNVEDKDSDCPDSKHLCESDLLGKRLRCPKTCGLYMEDEEYYRMLKSDISILSAPAPSCAQEK